MLSVVGLILLGWSLVALTWPLSGDDGVFAWIADTVHRGGAPYRDAWDTKGPGAWLPALLVQKIVGRNSWGIRAFDIAMVVAALFGIRSVARRIALPGGGAIAMALYALWYSSLDFWQSAQPDGWVASWLIVACSLVLVGHPVAALAAGALVGVATLSKPFYLGFAVVLWMLIALVPQRQKRQRGVQSMLVLVGIVATGAAILWLVKAWGGWEAYLDAQRWTRDVYAGLDTNWMMRFPLAFQQVLMTPWGVVVPFALFGAFYPPIKDRRLVWALIVGFLGAVAGVIVQGRFWTYHGLPMLPFLALLADCGFNALRREVAGVPAARFRAAALLLALAAGAIAPLQLFYRFTRSRLNTEIRARYERHEFRYYGHHSDAAYTIIDSLARIEPRPARIMMWAMHMGPYFVNDLTLPTRFAVIRPLFDGPGTSYRARYRAEFEAGMRASPARWWLIPSASLLNRDDELREREISTYPAVAEFLRANYRRAGGTEDWDILEYTGPIVR